MSEKDYGVKCWEISVVLIDGTKMFLSPEGKGMWSEDMPFVFSADRGDALGFLTQAVNDIELAGMEIKSANMSTWRE